MQLIIIPVPRAAIYARVSTTEQDEERQVQDLRRVAESRGWTLVEEIRERRSGARDDRPGLARLLDLARSGTVDVVLTTELSRLTRGGIGALFDIVRQFDAAGVRVHSIAEPWASVDGSTRDLLLAVMGWAAKLERDTIAERTRSGLAHTTKRVGRPPRVTSELVAEIRRLRDGDRLRWNQVAVRVHVPASSARKWYSAAKRAESTPPAESPRVINPV